MSDQPSWSAPGAAPPPPPTGAPYDVAPPAPPAPPAPYDVAPFVPPAPPVPPPRRGRGLRVAAAVLAVVVVGAGAGVVAAHGRSTAGRPVVASTSPAGSSASPSSSSAPPTASPTSTGPFAAPPSAPAPTALVPRSGTGAIGAALTPRGFDCLARRDSPTVGGCYLYDPAYASVEWLGPSDHPESIGVVVHGSLDDAVALQRSLPASTGMSGAAVDALVAAARASADHKATTATGYAHVVVGTTSGGTPRSVVDIVLPHVGRDAEYARAVLPAGYTEAEKSATDHGYRCQEAAATADGRRESTCRLDDATLTLHGDARDVLRSATAETGQGVDDLLRLLSDAGGDLHHDDTQAIIGMVRSVEGRDVGIAAADGFEVFCFSGGDVSCTVAPVDW